LKRGAINQLKELAKNYAIVAFSTEWRKDCAENIPVLGLISEATELKSESSEGLRKDPLNPRRRCRIPLIILFDKEGREVGKIVENPREESTLEEELLKIIGKNQV